MKPIEAVARAFAQAEPGAPMLDETWAIYGHEWMPGAKAGILALADNISDEAVEAFNEAHDAYWTKHWPSGEPPGFGKVAREADRHSLAAAIRALGKE